MPAERHIIVEPMTRAELRRRSELERWEGCRYEARGRGWSMRLSTDMIDGLVAGVGFLEIEHALQTRDLIDEHGALTPRGLGVAKAAKQLVNQ